MAQKLTIKILPVYEVVLKALAEREQEAVSVLVRRLIRAEAERQGLWPNSRTKDGEEHL